MTVTVTDPDFNLLDPHKKKKRNSIAHKGFRESLQGSGSLFRKRHLLVVYC